MPEWLTGPVRIEGDVEPEVVAARLAVAAVLGAAVAAVYYLTQRRVRTETSQFVATLVLLTVLLAMVTVVIGNNVARAFGLVGALSIVRFRTVVDDTRDTAFVIYAVVTGMAIGAGLLSGALVALPVVGVTAWLLNVWGRGLRGPPATLGVRLNTGLDPVALLSDILAKNLQDVRLVSVGTAQKGAALDLTYAVRLRPGVATFAFLGDLNRVEGVQGVEWKEPSPG